MVEITPVKSTSMIEKVTLGEALSALSQGKPSYMLGVSANNGLKVTDKDASTFIKIQRWTYEIDSGQEINLGNIGYGLFLVGSGDHGECATYGIWSRGTNDSSYPAYFGNFTNNTDAPVLFGRKKTNGDYYLKNNGSTKITVRITFINGIQ